MIEQWIALAATAAVLLLTGALALIKVQRQLRARLEQQAADIARLQREQTAINSAAIGVGQRLISAEKKLNAAVAKQEQQSGAGPVDEPLVQASISASGLSAQELVERFGLSEEEANLLALLKAHGGAANAHH